MSYDSPLQRAVLDELAWEPSVVADDIGVAVHDGIVSLTGHVASLAQRGAAETAARRVKGVVNVVETIAVRSTHGMPGDDADLARAAADRLAWDASLPAGAVTATVADGCIALHGQVGWNYQKVAAEQAVRLLRGVVGVTNHIRIMAAIDAGSVSDDITHALHRSWLFDPTTITVTAQGGRIRLTGTVPSWSDRQVAAATAWSAPGAVDVINDITVV